MSVAQPMKAHVIDQIIVHPGALSKMEKSIHTTQLMKQNEDSKLQRANNHGILKKDILLKQTTLA